MDGKPCNRKLNEEEVACFERTVADVMPQDAPSTSHVPGADGAQRAKLDVPPLKGTKRSASSQPHSASKASASRSEVDSVSAPETQRLSQAKRQYLNNTSVDTPSTSSKRPKKAADSRAAASSSAAVSPRIRRQILNLNNTSVDAPSTSSKIQKQSAGSRAAASSSAAVSPLIRRKNLKKTDGNAEDDQKDDNESRKRIKRGNEPEVESESGEVALNVGEWAELHELETWLNTPEALRCRGHLVETDKHDVKALLVHPSTRKILNEIGPKLKIPRNNETVDNWHKRCVQESLTNFQIWRRGGMSSWVRSGPCLPVIENNAAEIGLETMTDIQQKQIYWWSSVLAKIVRTAIALRAKHPQLLSSTKWDTLLLRLTVAMQSSSASSLRTVYQRHKEWIHEAADKNSTESP